MKNYRLQLMSVIVIMTFLIIACGSSGNGIEPSDNNNGSGGSNSSNNNSNTSKLIIPDQPGVAPSDVFDQVAFDGTGGGDGERRCPCVDQYDNGVYLDGFSSGLIAHIVVYLRYKEGYSDYGFFVTDGITIIGSSGSGFVEIENFDPEQFQVVVYDMSGEKIGPRTIIVTER